MEIFEYRISNIERGILKGFERGFYQSSGDRVEALVNQGSRSNPRRMSNYKFRIENDQYFYVKDVNPY